MVPKAALETEIPFGPSYAAHATPRKTIKGERLFRLGAVIQRRRADSFSMWVTARASRVSGSATVHDSPPGNGSLIPRFFFFKCMDGIQGIPPSVSGTVDTF